MKQHRGTGYGWLYTDDRPVSQRELRVRFAVHAAAAALVGVLCLIGLIVIGARIP